MACRNDSYLINVLNYSIVNNQIGYAHNYKPIGILICFIFSINIYIKNSK